MINLCFVITGGPGAGKTTILHALAERGYICAAESARAIATARLASGLSPRPPWAQFGNEMLQRDIARYRETHGTDHPVFFDRGIVDALGILDQQYAMSLGRSKSTSGHFLITKWCCSRLLGKRFAVPTLSAI